MTSSLLRCRIILAVPFLLSMLCGTAHATITPSTTTRVLWYNNQAVSCLSHDTALSPQSKKETAMLENDRNEQWLPVVGYEGIYSVSDMGRVRRDSRQRNGSSGYIVKGSIGDGYTRVHLYRGTRKDRPRFFVHRIVAEAFIGPRPNGFECNHKNGNRSDNRLENLEWVTRSENNLHAIHTLGRHVIRGSEHVKSKLSESDIPKIKQRLKDGRSQSQVGREFGISQTLVWAINKGKKWAHVI